MRAAAKTAPTLALARAAVAIGITALVYGAVGVLVKADDFGLLLSARQRPAPIRAMGRGLVRSMPALMLFIATLGTFAMLWVGGSILVHGLHDLGWHLPYEQIKHVAKLAADASDAGAGVLTWGVTAALDGIIGLTAGLVLIPVVTRAFMPVAGWLFPEKT